MTKVILELYRPLRPTQSVRCETIEAVFPRATLQLYIVHMVRHSLNYVSWKQRPEVAADLRWIYQSATTEEAENHLGCAFRGT